MSTPRINWKKKFEELELKYNELLYDNKALQTEISELTATIHAQAAVKTTDYPDQETKFGYTEYRDGDVPSNSNASWVAVAGVSVAILAGIAVAVSCI